MEIRFHCENCKCPHVANLRQLGEPFKCPHCGQDVRVPRIPANPYGDAIRIVTAQRRSIEWRFPYVVPLIEFAVINFVTVLLALLFCTVGVCAQVAGVLLTLIYDAEERFRQGSSIEKSAQAIVIGTYFLIFLPFYVVFWPFQMLGRIWSVFWGDVIGDQ